MLDEQGAWRCSRVAQARVCKTGAVFREAPAQAPCVVPRQSLGNHSEDTRYEDTSENGAAAKASATSSSCTRESTKDPGATTRCSSRCSGGLPTSHKWSIWTSAATAVARSRRRLSGRSTRGRTTRGRATRAEESRRHHPGTHLEHRPGLARMDCPRRRSGVGAGPTSSSRAAAGLRSKPPGADGGGRDFHHKEVRYHLVIMPR
jgi:hypothetical protein